MLRDDDAAFGPRRRFGALVHNTCFAELRRAARGLRDLEFSRAERKILLRGGSVDVAPGRLTRIHGIEPEGQAFINDLATEFRMARAFTEDPVTAVIGTRGRASLILTDGHHRRIAAMRAGMDVPVKLDLLRAHRWQEYEMHALQYLSEGM